jgi:mono/diheme cytochrome c family protein
MMTSNAPARLRRVLIAGAALAALSVSASGWAHERESQAEQAAPVPAKNVGMHTLMGRQNQMGAGMPGMKMPDMDPVRGRKLFVSKDCVACHAINGVGGHDATNLDAHTMQPMMNPFEFAAKMWRVAPYMIAAQEEALGGQILFTGDELAHIVAFVHNDDAQHGFSEGDLTPEAHRMMNHSHGEPGGGVAAHGEELGHKHMGEAKGHGHAGGGEAGHSD